MPLDPSLSHKACGWVLVKRRQHCSLAMGLHCELKKCKLLMKNSKVYQWPNECIGTSKYFGVLVVHLYDGHVPKKCYLYLGRKPILKVDYLSHI